VVMTDYILTDGQYCVSRKLFDIIFLCVCEVFYSIDIEGDDEVLMMT